MDEKIMMNYKFTFAFYAKAGVLYTLLPYLDSYELWQRIMTMTCKKSKKIWDENQNAFKALYKQTHKFKIDMIKNLHSEFYSKMGYNDNNLILSLNAYELSDSHFLQEMLKIRFLNYRSLDVFRIPADYQYIQALNDFFENLTPESIKIFLFRGWKAKN